MCRWLAYSGASISLDELIFKAEHSLIDQSLAARVSAFTTNGDGFGMGWYGRYETPGLYKSVRPAWNDANLRDLATHIESPLFIAHVRATTGSPVQRTNCHPFRHGRWLFAHNGQIAQFERLKRDLVLDVDAALFNGIAGSTDSEIMFFLALSYGLEDDPLSALAQMVGRVESAGREHGVPNVLDMTVCVSDGKRIYAVRYATDGDPPSLFHSRDVSALRELHPRFEGFSPDTRAVVSEPLGDIRDAWEEIAPGTGVVVEGQSLRKQPFAPYRP